MGIAVKKGGKALVFVGSIAEELPSCRVPGYQQFQTPKCPKFLSQSKNPAFRRKGRLRGLELRTRENKKPLPR
jgi:hypothetical protein